MKLVGHFPDTHITNVAGTPTQQFGSWTVIGPVAYYRTVIDLTGLNLQEQTFFPVNAMIQGNQEIITAGYATGDSVHDVTLVSTIALTDDALVNAGFGYLPGMTMADNLIAVLSSEDAGMDLQNIVFGQIRTWVFNLQTTPYMTLNNADNFGTNSGVASKRLYCYRIVRCPAPDSAELVVHPTAVVLAGVVDEEEDLDRLMRMKRNTELTR